MSYFDALDNSGSDEESSSPFPSPEPAASEPETKGPADRGINMLQQFYHSKSSAEVQGRAGSWKFLDIRQLLTMHLQMQIGKTDMNVRTYPLFMSVSKGSSSYKYTPGLSKWTKNSVKNNLCRSHGTGQALLTPNSREPWWVRADSQGDLNLVFDEARLVSFLDHSFRRTSEEKGKILGWWPEESKLVLPELLLFHSNLYSSGSHQDIICILQSKDRDRSHVVNETSALYEYHLHTLTIVEGLRLPSFWKRQFDVSDAPSLRDEHKLTPPTFYDSADQVTFDRNLECDTNIQHLVERKHRAKIATLSQLPDAVASMFLSALWSSALLTARRNFRIAVRFYYRDRKAYYGEGHISLLLPAVDPKTGKAAFAFVLQRRGARYEVVTMLELPMAFSNARVMCEVDQSWLRDTPPSTANRLPIATVNPRRSCWRAPSEAASTAPSQAANVSAAAVVVATTPSLSAPSASASPFKDANAEAKPCYHYILKGTCDYGDSCIKDHFKPPIGYCRYHWCHGDCKKYKCPLKHVAHPRAAPCPR